MAGMNGSCVVKPAAWDSLAKGSFSCRGLQVVEQGLSKKGLYLFQLCVAERPHLRLPFRGKRTAVFDLPLKEPRDQVAAFYSPLSTSSTQPPLVAPGPREALCLQSVSARRAKVDRVYEMRCTLARLYLLPFHSLSCLPSLTCVYLLCFY